MGYLNATYSEKADPTLYLADSMIGEGVFEAEELLAGYDKSAAEWELIVKHRGSLRQYEDVSFRVEELIAGYAIVTIDEKGWERLTQLQETEYIEKPRPMYPQTVSGQESACIFPVKRAPYSLTGKGVLVAVIDSSVDYTNAHFRNPDGTTRILSLWNQDWQGEDARPPVGFSIGTEYSRDEINAALAGTAVVSAPDLSGHGTAVAGILAGGRLNGFEGVATDASLLVVKLRSSNGNVFTQSADIMRAVTYALRKADEFNMPLVINLSYGTVWGAHNGQSLLERFMDNAAEIGRTSIVVGGGNDGAAGRHYRKKSPADMTERAELEIGDYEFGVSLHIFYPGQETYAFALITPQGRVVRIPAREELFQETYDSFTVRAVIAGAKPYTSYAEVFIQLSPIQDILPAGGWELEIKPVKVLTGIVDVYLSSSAYSTETTGFIRPESEMTLTVPATAGLVISVGAYSAYLNSYAPFSGRGALGMMPGIGNKPDLVAPGVNVRTVSVRGGYTTVSGTSFATPFVSGSAALMMEWGILRGNDPYLYGEKLKAFLTGSARRLNGFDDLPNEKEGWGALCLANLF